MVRRKEVKPIVIGVQDDLLYSITVLANGKHVVGGGEEGKVRRACSGRNASFTPDDYSKTEKYKETQSTQ